MPIKKTATKKLTAPKRPTMQDRWRDAGEDDFVFYKNDADFKKGKAMKMSDLKKTDSPKKTTAKKTVKK
jgi:hypothetical protein